MKARMLRIVAFVVTLICIVTLTGTGLGAGASGSQKLPMSPRPSVPLRSSPSYHLPFRLAANFIKTSSEPRSTELQPQTPLTRPVGIDLDVTYISRTPLYNRYEVWYTGDGKPYLRPGTEYDQRWPDHGQVVTFTAHIINKGTLDSGSFDFEWLIDDASVHSGTRPSLAPGEEVTETYQWTWAHTVVSECLQGQHTVAFQVDPGDTISETYESNNQIQDRTDALSLVLALTPDLYEALETPIDPQWPFSAEDWLQKQIAAMNQAFANSVYPSLPNGIQERVRLDKILVTSTNPPTDWAEDGGFFMTGDDRHGNAYYHPATDVSGALIHELTHQLGIIDLYNLDVPLEVPQVTDQRGRPVQIEYWPSQPGLMSNPGCDPPRYAEHTALALDGNKGYRRGYYGEYLYDVPQPTYLRLLDNQGNPAAGVTIDLYQRASFPRMRGSQHGVVDDTPEISVVTDEEGVALLPNRPVGEPVSTRTGHDLTDNPLGVINVVGQNDEFLVKISKGAHQEYQWLDVLQFNLTAWRGEDTLDLATHVPPDPAPAPPAALAGTQEYGEVRLQWQPSPSPTVSHYNVYRTEGMGYEAVVTHTTVLSYSSLFDYSARAAGYAVTGVDGSGRESGFSPPFWALRLQNPADVVVDENNERIVLDPQNGYALLLQSTAGEYWDTLGSFDLHLEYSWYLARDPAGNLIISHPSDAYSTRQSVRVADQDANLLFEFGEQGSGPGQFQGPAGVAVWTGPGVTDTYRILVADSGNDRIQAFDAQGNFVSEFGGYGSGSGEFSSPQGLAVDSVGNVVVADSGNDRLQVLSFDGNNFDFTRHFTAGLNGPTGVAAYGSNRIVVADTGNNKVKILDAQGNILADYDAPNDTYTGPFNQPRGVVADKSARVVVADTGNKRVVTILGALPVWPPADVDVTGPTAGVVQTDCTFTATVSPVTSTQPVTYVWQAAGHSPVTRTGGLSDTAVFTWTSLGSQAITVTAANAQGAVSDTHVIDLYAPVRADFVVSPTTGVAPLTVVFSNTSEGDYTESRWDLGNGVTSTLTSPIYTYTLAGLYTVTLTVSGPGGRDTLIRTNCVTVSSPVQADFGAWPTLGAPPLTVVFTNTSAGDYVTSLWGFGDGLTSTLENPTHTYTRVGAYTVTLTVSGAGGSDVETKVGCVSVEHRLYLPVVLRETE